MSSRICAIWQIGFARSTWNRESSVLLGLWPDMPEKPSSSSVLGDDARGAIRRATRRLLRVLEDAAAVEAAVRRILPEVTSLSSKVELVLQVGHQEDSGRKLVSETARTSSRRCCGTRFGLRPPTTSPRNVSPSRVLVFVKHYGGPPGRTIRERRLSQIDLCSPSIHHAGRQQPRPPAACPLRLSPGLGNPRRFLWRQGSAGDTDQRFEGSGSTP